MSIINQLERARNWADPTQEFIAAMIGAGLTSPDHIVADGGLHRFDSDGRRGKKTGWYVFHTDTPAAGVFGCWRQGFSQTWCSKSRDAMTETERQAHRRRMADMHRQREQETKDRQDEAKAECAELWAAAKPCPDGGHPYLTRKGIRSHNLRIAGVGDAARLLVPMRVNGELVSLQFIGVDGFKRFKTGGQVQGAYCMLGEVPGTSPVVVVCEGFATGASIHEATGLPVAVAFNAGNLKAAAQALRQRLPEAKIILAADDDHLTNGNPGLTKAREAALAVGGFDVRPQFPPGRPDKATDFNDLQRLAGPDSVRACFTEILEVVC
jgi:putative DNA primase/helicase